MVLGSNGASEGTTGAPVDEGREPVSRDNNRADEADADSSAETGRADEDRADRASMVALAVAKPRIIDGNVAEGAALTGAAFDGAAGAVVCLARRELVDAVPDDCWDDDDVGAVLLACDADMGN
jgi:hypothetical protein